MTHNANTSANAAIAANTQVVTATLNGVVENKHTTPTQDAAAKAAKAAEREAKAQERKAAQEREKRLAAAFDATTMSVGDALRAVDAHRKDELEDGYTVAQYMADFGMKKLTLKALKDALNADFVRNGVICMPTTRPATYESADEDENNGCKLYYCVVKNGKDGKRKVWKTAQVYDFAEIKLWTPAIIRRLLAASLKYDAAKCAKRNDEMQKCKHFYRLNERNETAVNGKKVNRKTVVEDYVEVAKEFVKF